MVKTFDIEQIRADFPTLEVSAYGKKLVYLDNGATAHKPKQVIAAEKDFYEQYNSNIHRGVHYLSQKATDAYERTRTLVKEYINAPSLEEVIFTSGTTQAINLVAYSFGKKMVQPGDEIIISALEHHANIVPWQIMCEDRGAVLKVIPMNDLGELDMTAYAALLTNKTKLVAFNHVSNALGIINPAKQMIGMAHEKGAVVLVDGAQAVPHMKVDVQDLNADFYCFSGHKLFGPTGTGVLFGKKELLNAMPPYQGGGEMIKTVTFEKTTYNELPHKFEAGTPNIAGGIALGAAVTYMNNLDMGAIQYHEQEILAYATSELLKIEGLKIYGEGNEKVSVISFLIDGIHPYDLGTIMDKMGVAVRTGHHCTQPIMERFGITGTVRASFAFYNTMADVDRLIEAVNKAKNMLQ
ncbi:MAG: cysteine desulfurase/selenocysteine lyase [Flavobacteriales bacterium]|jgi:cysteine desulfurase/selenocysteine lyase